MEQEPFEFPPELFGQVPLFAEIAKAMSWAGGPINWDMARQIASAMAGSTQTPPIIDADIEELNEAARLAEAWLEESAGFPTEAGVRRLRPATPSTWVEGALARYPELLDPLGGKLSGALANEGGDPSGQMTAVVRQIIPLFLGIQCGSVLGALSRSILTGYDVPLPVEDESAATFLVAHVDAHAREYAIDRRELRYWTALHATAHRVIYDGFPWTRAHFWSLYHGYLAAVDVNLSETLERLQSLDFTSPEQLQAAMGQDLLGLGAPGGVGPAQDRLQQFLALIEAACDRATDASAAGKLLSLGAIRESMIRRGAESASGERALERFVGTEIPPAIANRAGAFCDGVLERSGWPALNGMWEDTERLPSAEELADPEAWLRRI